MRITRREDYAILILSILAGSGAKPTPAPILARTHHLPIAFVHQILQDLRKGGLVESKKGVDGGYCLARPASRVTLTDILETLSGPTVLTRCTSAKRCSLESHCQTRMPWQRLHAMIRSLFSMVTLEQIATNTLPKQ